ncbi:prophage PSSB64-02, partial [Pseudomonas coronafaciens]
AVFWAGDYWATTDDGVARVVCEPLAAWRVE